MVCVEPFLNRAGHCDVCCNKWSHWQRAVGGRAAAMICPRLGLQVATRYTSCTDMDRSPLLYVHVSYQYNEPKLPGDLDLWPFDLESGIRVTCDVGYLFANFSLPRPHCSRVTPDTWQTDVRQKHYLMPPSIRGGGIKDSVPVKKFRHW